MSGAVTARRIFVQGPLCAAQELFLTQSEIGSEALGDGLQVFGEQGAW